MVATSSLTCVVNAQLGTAQFDTAQNTTAPAQVKPAKPVATDAKLIAIDSVRYTSAATLQSNPQSALTLNTDVTKSRTRWIKSTLETIPSLPWRSISSDGFVTSMTTTSKEGVLLLTGVEPSGKHWLVAVNSFPWLEQFECHWNAESPADLRETSSIRDTNAESGIDRSSLSIVAGTHHADVARFQVNSVEKVELVSGVPNEVEVVSDSKKVTSQPVAAHDGWRFRLPAMSMTAWTWSGEHSIASWTHLASQEGVDLMTENVAAISDVIQLMTNFRTDFGHQMDGSFEATKVDQVKESPTTSTTWLFSMNPTVTWSNSTDQSHEPGLSLQYESFNDQSSGWIQTRAIPRRVKWPLAVEVWIKIDSQTKRPTVRLITTGVLGEIKRTESKQIDTPEFKEGVADTWKRYEFPSLRKTTNTDHSQSNPQNPDIAAPLPPSPSELLQWTIEVAGTGRLWIDDVGLSPLVLTDEERRLLRSQLFVAKRELEQKRPVKALEWIESPLVCRILQLSQECPPDFLKPVSRTIKPVAQTKRPIFLQSTSGWFWRPGKADIEPDSSPPKIRIVEGIPLAPDASVKR